MRNWKIEALDEQSSGDSSKNGHVCFVSSKDIEKEISLIDKDT